MAAPPPRASAISALRHLALVLALVLAPQGLWTPPARAGAWSPAANHGYAKLWVKYLYGFGYGDQQGVSHDYGRYHEVFVNGYGELGLGYGLALSLHFPFYKYFALENTRTNDMGRHHTVGEPTLGLRYQLWDENRWAVALELHTRAPTAPSGPQQPFYDADGTRLGALRIGEGAWDFGLSGNLGYGWNRIYLQGSAGYIVRSDGYEDVVHATLEVGGNLRNRWDGRARLVSHTALPNGTAPLVETPSGIGNGVSYVGFALELEYRMTDTWVVGSSFEGGLGGLRSQTGGPVVTSYVATSF